jgi:uncharacterized membrane protein YfcA
MGAMGLLSLGAFGLFVGALIGGVGIGGVLLVPGLVYVGGVEIRVAIAAAMFSYLFSGLVGATIYARRGSIRWGMGAWLIVGAMPGAFLGAAAMSVIPAGILEFAIALVIILAGANALRPGRQDPPSPRAPRRPWLAGIGAVTGFGSALTGTGGPLILVPILVWLETPVLTAVGLSQAIQIPVAFLATAGNLTYGRVDVLIGGSIAVALMAGAAIGARLAHAVSQALLKRLVAGVLVAVGGLILAKLAIRGFVT